MCGRVTRKTDKGIIEERFQVIPGPTHIENPDLSPGYNISPGENMAGIFLDQQGLKKLQSFCWGLVNSWDVGMRCAYKKINARSESIHMKPSFRNLISHQRCLIIVDGFYEWKRSGKEKKPFYFSHYQNDLLALAGLWDIWQKSFFSCTVITTEANEIMAPIHFRSPVIISPEDWDSWLNPDLPIDQVDRLLTPYSSQLLKRHPVDPRVNSTHFKDPISIEPYIEGGNSTSFEQLSLF